ncbi:MAG: hypothetical protein R3E95_08215 [Thiolinea sp.]
MIRMWLGRWQTHWEHLLWRLSLWLPLLFTRYVSAEEVYEERELSAWKLGLVSVAVLTLSIGSFSVIIRLGWRSAQ